MYRSSDWTFCDMNGRASTLHNLSIAYDCWFWKIMCFLLWHWHDFMPLMSQLVWAWFHLTMSLNTNIIQLYLSIIRSSFHELNFRTLFGDFLGALKLMLPRMFTWHLAVQCTFCQGNGRHWGGWFEAWLVSGNWLEPGVSRAIQGYPGVSTSIPFKGGPMVAVNLSDSWSSLW